jgi:hypothetical protein
MLRQHVYYSITFIPGQFTPDIWSVDLKDSVNAYDSVSIFNSDQWQVPEKLWHRNTLFLAGLFNAADIDTSLAVKGVVVNSFIVSTSALDKTKVVSSKTLNTFVALENAWSKSSITSAKLLRTFIINDGDLVLNEFNNGKTSFKVLSINQNSVQKVDCIRVGKPILTLAPVSSNTSYSAISNSVTNQTYIEPKLEAKASSKAFGNVSFKYKNFDQIQASSLAINEHIIYSKSNESSQSLNPQYIRGV